MLVRFYVYFNYSVESSKVILILVDFFSGKLDGFSYKE